MRRMNAGMSVTVLMLIASIASAQEDAPAQTLFTDVRVWDGTSDGLTDSTNVLVVDNLIHSIGPDVTGENAVIIDGGGRTLMPGLIDMHTHTGLKRGVPDTESMWDGQSVGAMAHETMMDYLDMGYTTLRDICAGSLGVARAVAAGVLTALAGRRRLSPLR